MVGDSVSWRGSDELARLRPELTVDAEPARRPTELAARLDAFRARHGQPAGLVVELGTNPAPGFRPPRPGRRRAEPPDRDPGHAGAALRRGQQRPGGRRRRGRGGSAAGCAPSPPAVRTPVSRTGRRTSRSHPGLLQDGIHPRNDAESVWARWILDAVGPLLSASVPRQPRWRQGQLAVLVLVVEVARVAAVTDGPPEIVGIGALVPGRAARRTRNLGTLPVGHDVTSRSFPRRSRSRGTSPTPSACGARGRSARSGAARPSRGTR